MTTTSEGVQLDQLAAADRSNRVGRTLQQVAPVSAIVGLVGYGLSFLDVDLAPLDPDSRSLPEWVVASVIAVGTWLTARRMNRPPDDPSSSTVDAAAAVTDEAPKTRKS